MPLNRVWLLYEGFGAEELGGVDFLPCRAWTGCDIGCVCCSGLMLRGVVSSHSGADWWGLLYCCAEPEQCDTYTVLRCRTGLTLRSWVWMRSGRPPLPCTEAPVELLHARTAGETRLPGQACMATCLPWKPER